MKTTKRCKICKHHYGKFRNSCPTCGSVELKSVGILSFKQGRVVTVKPAYGVRYQTVR